MDLCACPCCGAQVRKDRLSKHVEQRCDNRPMPHPFADILPRRPVPDWLTTVAGGRDLPAPIPLRDVLSESCFYPASGLDSSPVVIANGFLHSFVYVDYGVQQEDYLRELREIGFRGYRLLLSRDVEREEVVPRNWIPRTPTQFDEANGHTRLIKAQKECRPFGHWSVWQRRDRYDDRVGPALFSVFFLGGEGVACFDGLYARNCITPTMCSIIQPGHALGNNWTNFFRPDGPLWTTIKETGQPGYLLIGTYGYGRGEEPRCPFEGYRFLRRARTVEPDKEWYTYNEQGEKTCHLIVALMSKESGFEIKKDTVEGMAHTIDIFEK